MELKANAKINLSIDILSKRKDNYHLVEMIMQEIDLHDVIRIKKTEDHIRIHSTNKELPTNEDNIVYKVADYMIKTYHVKSGVDITIEKNIPMAAGLAGGSTDAAATIKGMNELFSLHLTMDEMKDIAVKFGADISFCLVGGACLATNIGEELSSINPLDAYILLVNPDISVSTKEVYQQIDISSIKRHPNTKYVVEIIKNNEKDLLESEMYNVLEEITATMYPEIKTIEEKMYQNGAIVSMMSGSGPTVFGIYNDHTSVLNAYHILKKEYNKVYIAHTIDGSNNG